MKSKDQERLWAIEDFRDAILKDHSIGEYMKSEIAYLAFDEHIKRIAQNMIDAVERVK